MVVYAATSPTYRTPVRRVVVGGEIMTRVLSSTVTRGWDQDVATCGALLPYPPPPSVGKNARIQVYMGASQAGMALRFTGYITQPSLTLWPGRVFLGCEDMLARAKYFKPDAPVAIANLDDAAAVSLILTTVGLPVVAGMIGGTGKIIGTDEATNPALIWQSSVTALEMIQQIDRVSVYDTADGFKGIYRTYADPGGIIRRIPLHPLPAATPAHTFTEGIDLEQGSTHVEAVPPSKVATAAGAAGLSVTLTGTNPFATNSNPDFQMYPLLDVIDGGGTQLDLTDQSAYQLQTKIANLVRVDIAIRRDDVMGAFQTDRIIAPHQTTDILALLQSVTTTMPESGGFTQQASYVSYRELNIFEDPDTGLGGFPEFDPDTGAEIDPGDFPDLPDFTDGDALVVSFNVVGIDRELAGEPSDAGDTGQYWYIVSCEDTTVPLVGTIATEDWTAAGPDVRITSGSGPLFTTAFSALDATALITLTVTDSLGNTASLTLPAQDGTTPVRNRTLFACTDTNMYANDGDVWRVQAPTGGVTTVYCVANGPMWGVGRYVAVSEDFLVTTATQTAAFAASNVTSIWISETNSLFAAAASGSGEVAVTRDRGATWEARTSPDATLSFIIVSIHDTSELHAVGPGGWWTSHDEGNSWELVRAGDFVYLELSHTRNIIVTAAGTLEKAEDGTAFTGITGTVVAATSHIRQDRFYALTSDGNTWVSDAEGSYAMVAGAPIPDGAPHHAGTYRDGLIIDLVYFAAESGGLFKTIDGFKTANGYLRLLTEGRVTP